MSSPRTSSPTTSTGGPSGRCRRARRIGHPRPRRTARPSLRPGSLDLALLVHMYHEVTQPYGLLSNLRPALRPGARVAVIDARKETASHGTPPDLLRCELAAVGYRQTAFYDLQEKPISAVLSRPPAQPRRPRSPVFGQAQLTLRVRRGGLPDRRARRRSPSVREPVDRRLPQPRKSRAVAACRRGRRETGDIDRVPRGPELVDRSQPTIRPLAIPMATAPLSRTTGLGGSAPARRKARRSAANRYQPGWRLRRATPRSPPAADQGPSGPIRSAVSMRPRPSSICARSHSERCCSSNVTSAPDTSTAPVAPRFERVSRGDHD